MSALDFSLSSALLIPDFVEQALGSGLFDHVEDTQLTPLDDLKDWMRSDPWRAGDLFGRVDALLLGEERAARKAAEKAGLRFDLVDYELGRLDDADGYERFDARQAAEILRLAVEEADALQAYSRKSAGVDFALAVGFQLPDPRRHPRFTREDLARALGGRERPELAGAFQVDLSPPGGGPALEERNGVGFLRVPCEDPRVGDGTVAHLSLAYPLEARGYFLLTFEALRRALSLGARDAGAD